MRIAILGRGNVGGGLARLWEKAGHEVVAFGRDGGDASSAEVIVAAVPSDSVDDAFSKVTGFEGKMTIDFRDGSVALSAGEMFVVPRGKEHRPRAAAECKIMLIEPVGTANTGDAGGRMTAPNDVWI